MAMAVGDDMKDGIVSLRNLNSIDSNESDIIAMAMAVGDDMKDGSVSLLNLNSIGSNESGRLLSPEDVAWADSCLIKDLGVLDFLTHDLPETFPSQNIFSVVMRDDSPQEYRNFPMVEEIDLSEILDDMVDDVSPTNEQDGNTILHKINNKDTDRLWSRINSENVFLPTYNEALRLVNESDSEADSEFPTFVEEIYADNIFKVWELDFPDEEDELVKQLNKALKGSSLDSSPSASENLGVLLDNKLLDDLISGLGDLSLSPTSD